MSIRRSSFLEMRITSDGHREYTSLKRRLSKDRNSKQGSHRAKLMSRFIRSSKISPSQVIPPLFELKFGNSADISDPFSEFIENVELANNHAQIQPEEEEVRSRISTDSSFEQGDAPVSKRKKLNHGFRAWISKISYYKNHGVRFFGYPKDLRQEGQLFEHSEPDLNQEALPEEAYSCYNRFKTVDFNNYYEELKFDLSSFDDNLRLSIPVFSPSNELIYEGLQQMRQQCFGLPESLVDNGLSSAIVLNEQTLPVSSEPGTLDRQIGSALEGLPTQPDGSNCLHELTKTPESADLLEQFNLNMKVFLDYNEEEDSAVKDLYEEISDGLEKSGYVSSTNSVPIDDALNSTATAVLHNDESLSRDPELMPMDSTVAGASGSFRMSIVAKVKSAFKSEPQTSRSSSVSSYSPVSIAIPALKNGNLVFEISEEIANGIPIEPVYHPEDIEPRVEDENTPFNIKEAAVFETGFYGNNEDIDCDIDVDEYEGFPSTIKFEKFAQVLLYNGSKRLKKSKDPIDSARVAEIQEQFKNRGSLELASASSTEALKIKSVRKKNLGLFRVRSLSASSVHRQGHIEEAAIKEEPIQYEVNSLPSKSILKSRRNMNVDVESVRANHLDDIAIDEFLTFFADHEKKRLESEPVLERYRENQLIGYYLETGS